MSQWTTGESLTLQQSLGKLLQALDETLEADGFKRAGSLDLHVLFKKNTVNELLNQLTPLLDNFNQCMGILPVFAGTGQVQTQDL